MAKTTKRKPRKNVAKGIAHVKATFNNTHITITTVTGDTLSWGTAGAMGFKGTRKSTPFAAQRAADRAAAAAQRHGLKEVEVRVKGNTGENLLMLLSRRLDNVVLTSGFALTLPQARQLVNHGHFMVNGKRATIPSIQVKPGDVITPRAKENTKKLVSEAVDVTKGVTLPGWLEVSADTLTATVTGVPSRTDFQFPIQEQLIVELCSK